MTTVFDWLTMAIFCVLVVIFLQRSAGERPEHDVMWKYLPAALGCMIANYIGNHGWLISGTTLITATMIYSWHIIYKGHNLPRL